MCGGACMVDGAHGPGSALEVACLSPSAAVVVCVVDGDGVWSAGEGQGVVWICWCVIVTSEVVFAKLVAHGGATAERCFLCLFHREKESR